MWESIAVVANPAALTEADSWALPAKSSSTKSSCESKVKLIGDADTIVCGKENWYGPSWTGPKVASGKGFCTGCDP